MDDSPHAAGSPPVRALTDAGASVFEVSWNQDKPPSDEVAPRALTGYGFGPGTAADKERR